MIELNSVLVILIVEALCALIILCVWWFWKSRKTNQQNFALADKLVDNLDSTEAERTKQLASLIAQRCSLDQQTLNALLKDIAVHEKALYRLVVQIFLNREPELLNDLHAYIYDLAKPYSKMLQYGSVSEPSKALQAMNSADKVELELANKEILRLVAENTTLTEELQEALATLESVSDEYARVFSGTQAEAELHASSKRMLAVFEAITKTIKEKPSMQIEDNTSL